MLGPSIDHLESPSPIIPGPLRAHGRQSFKKSSCTDLPADQAFTRGGPVNIRNARHAEDPRPLDETLACPASRDYSRAYLHHLARSREILGAMLLTWHNLYYYQDLMARMRRAIGEGRFQAFAAEFAAEQANGDIEPL